MQLDILKNKVLMITGGTGSFGKTLLNRLLSSDLKEILIYSRDEKKQEDMRISYSNPKVRFCLGDVRDYNSVVRAIKGVHYVFHAAALKQVPSCEFFPMEAVATNIEGTANVVNAAADNNVEKLVLLSTDKAVYPINAMGISKAMAEKVLIAKSRILPIAGPILCATRYGNVMASRGSVIPLFVDKIKSGRPLTITDPTMTRFLMSLDESVDLVMHAFKHGCQGDIFVQKAPAASISTLAVALQELFNSKSDVKIIGSRHGEKLFETLVSREEISKAVDMGRYYRIPADNRGLDYDKYILDGVPETNSLHDYTSHNTQQLSVEQVKELLMNLDFIKNQIKNSSRI